MPNVNKFRHNADFQIGQMFCSCVDLYALLIWGQILFSTGSSITMLLIVRSKFFRLAVHNCSFFRLVYICVLLTVASSTLYPHSGMFGVEGDQKI